jgi:hypothetical protein
LAFLSTLDASKLAADVQTLPPTFLPAVVAALCPSDAQAVYSTQFSANRTAIKSSF